MRVSETGEFGLIANITSLVNRKSNKNAASWQGLIMGAGDDTAAWKPEKGIELATTDIMVEGTHFDFSITSWHDLGWKSIAVNISDIAAMGGSPRYALVSLALPPVTQVEDVLDMYRGMLSICNLYGITVAGGNIASAEKVSVNIAMTGICTKKPMDRFSAKAGDLIAVTGYPGLSAAGLQATIAGINMSARARKLYMDAHLRPIPQVEVGLKLSSLGVKTAIDTSDGLIADLGHICQASRKSAVIHSGSLPVHPLLTRYFPHDYLQMMLSGGEDYGLLFTAGIGLMEKVKSSLPGKITVMGEIAPAKTGKITVLDQHGKAVKTGPGGWDHYKR